MLFCGEGYIVCLCEFDSEKFNFENESYYQRSWSMCRSVNCIAKSGVYKIRSIWVSSNERILTIIVVVTPLAKGNVNKSEVG